MNEIKLGRFVGLKLSAIPSAMVGSLVLWVVLSGAASFFVMTLGALTPLGFNDGGTLAQWWGKR
jgi:hypothetical protein